MKTTERILAQLASALKSGSISTIEVLHLLHTHAVEERPKAMGELLIYVRDSRADLLRNFPQLCELFGGLLVYEALTDGFIKKQDWQQPGTVYMCITEKGRTFLLTN